jgi:hypothetical protein
LIHSQVSLTGFPLSVVILFPSVTGSVRKSAFIHSSLDFLISASVELDPLEYKGMYLEWVMDLVDLH